MTNEVQLNIPQHENPVSGEVATATETKAPEPTTTKEDTALSPKFAALAKKAKAAYQAQAQLKAEKASLEAKRKEIDEFSKYKQEATSNPLKALEALGWKYDDLVNFVLNDQQPTSDQKLSRVEQQLEAFKREQEAKEQGRLEQERLSAQKQYEETIDAFKSRVSQHVTSNSEKYELINLHEAQDLIFDTIEEYFNKTNQVMDIAKAAELVENYLENQFETTFQKSKKVQSKLAPKKEEPQPQSQNKSTSVSLNNQVSASSAAPGYLPPKTEQERIQRALAKLAGG